MAGTKKTFTRVKEINQELKETTEIYMKEVLERTDELEQLGKFADAKEFSKKLLELSELVPPKGLEA